MNAAYYLAQLGFIILTIVFYGLLLRLLMKALHASTLPRDRQRRIFNGSVIGIVLWMVISSALSLSGVLSDFNSFPPKMFIVLIIPLITIIWIITRKTTAEIVRRMPAEGILYLQVFRVFVEVLLWMLFVQQLLPVQMTFEGRNFDILSGLTAPLVAWLYQRQKISKTIVIIWNFLSLALLANIVTIALLSFPTPFRYFHNEPSNTIVAKFPFVWLPALLVPLAYGLHALSLKRLMRKD